MTEQTNRAEADGLPDIAESSRPKNWIILLCLAFMLSVMAILYFVSAHHLSADIHTEGETYTLTNNTIADKQVAAKQVAQLQPVTAISADELALLKAKQVALQQRLEAPLMVVNQQTSQATDMAVHPNRSLTTDANMRFLNQVADNATETVQAKTIGPLHYLIAEGTFIHANLEPAINSDLPGNLRAIVNEPVYSEDGSQVLIPRGSRLIGQYRSGLLQGAARIFVVWTRVITPKGISVQLGSPGVDSLGMAGQGADGVDRHFWQRFGTGALLSLLGAGAANVGVSSQEMDNSAAAYRTAVASSFSQSANQALQQDMQIAPTLKVYQGKTINVFVAKDLNFQSAMQQVSPTINVF